LSPAFADRIRPVSNPAKSAQYGQKKPTSPQLEIGQAGTRDHDEDILKTFAKTSSPNHVTLTTR
jgi:hypothetical protein